MNILYIHFKICKLIHTYFEMKHLCVQIMLFPGLWFTHEGRVLSLDLLIQPSDQLTFARVQILRPYCSPNHHLVPPGEQMNH